MILQARVPVLPGDDESTLAKRVLEKEHIIYPLTVRWFAEQRLKLEGNHPVMDGVPLSRPVQLSDTVQ